MNGTCVIDITYSMNKLFHLNKYPMITIVLCLPMGSYTCLHAFYTYFLPIVYGIKYVTITNGFERKKTTPVVLHIFLEKKYGMICRLTYLYVPGPVSKFKYTEKINTLMKSSLILDVTVSSHLQIQIVLTQYLLPQLKPCHQNLW